MAAGIDVSVLIPIHASTPERLEWLEEAVESVRSQLYPHKRVMICDDASPFPVSTDTFRDCVVFRHRERQGVCRSRNLLGERCETDWLLWLDADDKLYEGALEKLVEAASPNRVTFGNLMLFGNGYTARYYPMHPYDGCRLLSDPIVPVTTLHTKGAFHTVQGFDPAFEDGLEDWDYNIRLMLAGYCGNHIEQPLMWYRRHPGQRSKGAHWLRQMTGKIHERYQSVGGMDMPCCGGGGSRRGNPHNNPRVAANQAALAALGPQSGEMVLVRYTGRRMGATSVRGKGTGQKYRFSAQDRDRWVWPQDVRELVRLPDYRVVPRESLPTKPDEELLEQEVVAPPPPPVASMSGGVPTKADDLTAISGLGGKRQETLKAVGISRFEHLAVADAAFIAEAAGVGAKQAQSWIEQARGMR